MSGVYTEVSPALNVLVPFLEAVQKVDGVKLVYSVTQSVVKITVTQNDVTQTCEQLFARMSITSNTQNGWLTQTITLMRISGEQCHRITLCLQKALGGAGKSTFTMRDQTFPNTAV